MITRFSQLGRRGPLLVASSLRRWAWMAALGLLACSGDASQVSGGSCADGQVDCGQCTDLLNNLEHCGACGTSCSAGEDCVGGTCECAPGLVDCAGECVSQSEDADHCGGCNRPCGEGLVCSQGECKPSCDLGLSSCGQSCADPQASAAHCGGCDVVCDAGEICRDASCVCTQGRTPCESGCADLETDADHCGACGVVCAPGQTCRRGECFGSMGTGGGSVGVGGSAEGSVGGGFSTGSTLGGGGLVSGNGGSMVNPTGGVLNGGGSSTGGATSAGGGVSSGGEQAGGGSAAGGTSGAGGGGSTGGTVSTGGQGNGSCAASGFYVEGGKLYDVNCNEFIMRGVNYPYTWFKQYSLDEHFGAMSSGGANVVRVVLSTGGRWPAISSQELEQIIAAAKAAKLVTMVEVHDTTGYAEQADSVPMTNATQYWQTVLGTLSGQEAYVLLNIANEPHGNDSSDASWVPDHVAAVQALRSAGLTHTLIVDGPNWGQDWQNLMRDGGGAPIWNADDLKNLVFSVHMYDVYGDGQTVSNYFSSFLSNYEAPLIVGEFAADHGPGKDVDETRIMSDADSLGIGYLGWSWSGNGGDLGSLDIVNDFQPGNYTTWGSSLMSELQMTGEKCTCFD